MSVTAAHTMVTAFSLLLPLNLVAIAFIKERGTISRTGRRRLAIGAIQIIAIAILCLPIVAPLAAKIDRPFIPLILTRWTPPWAGDAGIFHHRFCCHHGSADPAVSCS